MEASLTASRVEVEPSRVENTNVDQKPVYEAKLGGITNTYREVISNSFSPSQASFSCNPPSPNTLVDRRVYLKVPVTVDFTGVSGSGNLLQANRDAFRAFPLASIIDNLQVTINNTKLTIESSEVIHELMRFYGEPREQEHLSGSPCFMDQSQEYSQLALSNRNPLARYGEKGDGQPGRGGYPYTVYTNTSTTAQVQAVLTEPLVISPLLFGGHDAKGLVNVQNMSVQINWSPNASRIWSHDSTANTINSIQVSFGRPSLLFNYITPSPTMSIPDVCDYQFQDVEVYTSELGSALTPGQSAQINSSNIQLNVIPSHLLVYVKKRRNDRTFEDTDSYLPISSLDMNFANVSGMFSGASQEQLYNLYRDNGGNQSWSEWSAQPMYATNGLTDTVVKGPGGILCLKFGKDIALQDPSLAVGVPGTFNLQLRCTVSNERDADVSPTLYVVPIYEGILSLSMNQAVQQLSVLSQEDILAAAKKANNEGAMSSEGGKIMGDIASGFKKALPWIRRARKVGQAVSGAIPQPQAQAVKAALDVAEELGLGEGGMMHGGTLVGGTAVGGKKMSRDAMRRKLLKNM